MYTNIEVQASYSNTYSEITTITKLLLLSYFVFNGEHTFTRKKNCKRFTTVKNQTNLGTARMYIS